MLGSKASWVILAPVLLHTVVALDKYIQDADRFPGWKGELPKAGQPGVELAVGEHGKVLGVSYKQLVTHRAGPVPGLQQQGFCCSVQDHWVGEVIELSWEPRAFLFKKFMTDEECDHVIAKVTAGPCTGPLHLALRFSGLMLEQLAPSIFAAGVDICMYNAG